MSIKSLLILAVACGNAFGDVITGIPDAAPPGFEEWESPIVTPAKPVAGDADWSQAVAKARNFVSQLTLEEKVNLTTGVGVQDRCVGNTGHVTRIGFPGFCFEDSPLGVRFTDFVSAFPAGINAAATWDKNLINQRGVAMGSEFRGKGVNFALGPMMNMGRVAAGGRNWEGFGADPFLAGVAAAETVKGIQSQNIIATAKHFIANEQEHFRGGGLPTQVYSSNVDDKTMHEVYLWPFAESVAAGVGSVMCSYNFINQTQACQNSKLMNGILKEELDFQGPIMSDWAAMINGVQPALAGLDIDMPGFLAYGLGPQAFDPLQTTNSFWGRQLVESVNNGSVPESRVDDMVVRSMAAFFKMGQDNDFPAVNFDQLTENTFLNGVQVNQHVNVQDDHYKLIREIGAASTILLKNTGNALPLSVSNIKRLAIIGSDAGPNPDGPNGCGDRGCDQGTLAMGWGSGTANFPYLIDPNSAIQSFIRTQKPNMVIEAVLNDFNYGQVTSVASQADTCLVFVNADSGEGYINVDGNAGDRNNLTTWHAGDTLIATTASVCANTIVVGHWVGPVIVEPWIENPNVTAVLSAGLPGQESGNAIVDVLFGGVNPSGRLPYTIAKDRSDYGADVLYSSSEKVIQITYDEGVNIDYRHFDAENIDPRFEFGFGLSYTTFKYSGLHVQVQHWNQRRAANVEVSVSASLAMPSFSHASKAASLPVPTSAAPTSIVASVTATSPSTSLTGSKPLNTSITSISAPLNATATSANATITPSSNITATATASAPPAISSPAQHNPGGPAELFETAVTITYSITNSGKMDGNEVSQVYLEFPAEAGQPPKVLRGFERTFIHRGRTASVTVPLRVKDVSYWDVVKQQWVIPHGTFNVFVGSSSRNVKLQGAFWL